MQRDGPRLGGVVLETDRSRFAGPDGTVHVEPRVMEVAMMLRGHPNEVVGRDSLIEEIWGNYPGADPLLTNAVSKLRHYLASVGGDASVIQTIPKRGYRAKVSNVRTAHDSVPSEISLAVLPFRNLAGDPENDHLCEGLAEDVLDMLGHVKGLRVAARASTVALVNRNLPLPEFGEYLDVDYVLDGSLRRIDGGFRVAVTLATTAQQTQIWSSQFECGEEGIEDLKTRIARALLRELPGCSDADRAATIIARSAAQNTEAYNAFLKGRYLWYRENTNPGMALEQFHHAIEVAPDFALPYAGLVDCYCTYGLWQIIPQQEARKKALENAEHAMSLAPELPDVLFSYGYAQFYMRWRWSAAEQIFQRVLEQSPEHIAAISFIAHLYAVLGRDAEAVRLGQQLTEIDPISWWCWYFRAVCAYWTGDFELAASSALEARELSPGNPLPLFIAASSQALRGRCEEALKLARELEQASGSLNLFLAIASSVYVQCDAHGDSDRIAAQLHERDRISSVGPMVLSALYAGRGQAEEAIANLKAALKQPNTAMFVVVRDPLFDSVRSCPEFQQILSRMALPQAT